MWGCHRLDSPFCARLPVASTQTCLASRAAPNAVACAPSVSNDSRQSSRTRATRLGGMPRSVSSQTPARPRSRRAVSCSRRVSPISSDHRAAELQTQASSWRRCCSRVRYSARDSMSPACTPPAMPASARWYATDGPSISATITMSFQSAVRGSTAIRSARRLPNCSVLSRKCRRAGIPRRRSSTRSSTFSAPLALLCSLADKPVSQDHCSVVLWNHPPLRAMSLPRRVQ